MGKKSKKRPRKRKRLTTDSKRQAHASLKGYLYQIWHSVNAWLDLDDDDLLYLEGAEDFDIVSDDTATATQVKHSQRNITLRSQEVIDAINHYWELRSRELHKNPDQRVKFRLLTRSKITVEQGNPFGKGNPGLEVWGLCSGNEVAIEKISEFLQAEEKISDEVKKFLKQAEPQEICEQLIEPIAWETDGKSAGYVEQSIREYLIHHGDRYGIPPSDAEKVIDSLITEAWRAASDDQNLELTRKRFLEIFAENTRVSVPIQDTRNQQTISLKTFLDSIKEALLGDSPDVNIAIQSKFHGQNTVPPLLPDAIPREELLTSIQTKLQSEGIAIIQGGTGRGKTTLANLTTKNVDGDWSWLNFTNKDPSQVAQQLKQVAIAISNQSTQVNVVLDDLNLQPQQLRTYEDALGIVIYRVLERGAKLLITSQHKPPNNFVLRLGVSKAIAVDVHDFTISEIEQFAQKLGSSDDSAKAWAKWIRLHTGGHPRLVHARLDRLREEGWQQPETIENILQTPQEVVEELEEARWLLADLPENHREFLYRLSLMVTEFRRECALNIGKIPEPITHPGLIFSQLVGPWIDQVSKTYYTISPLLTDASKEAWPDESEIKNLHAQIADAILKTKDLTITEAWTVLLHSMRGENRTGLIAVIWELIVFAQDNWEIVSEEFSFLIPMKIDLPEKLFIGDAFVKYLIRFLQYRIAAKVKPEFAPKILEVWDKETKSQQANQSYQLLRRMLAMEALRYNQVLLPAKQMMNYLQEVIEITNNDEEVEEVHGNFIEQLGKTKTDKSSFFSVLFSFIYARRPVYAPFLSELIDALDELQPEIRKLLLADFENDTIDARILINGVWLSEADLEKPNWSRCLGVYDKVIEKAIAWGYPYIAAASAIGKSIIHDEKLNVPHTAHKVLQDILLKVGTLPGIEEAQAVVYFRQENYREALNIYERILQQWKPPSEQLNIGPLEQYHRAAFCAASLDDWEKAAAFLEEGAKRTQKIENTERYIGLYADAGFAHFKASNVLDSIKLLSLALQEFEKLAQDNTELKYFTLKKRLVAAIQWMVAYNLGNYSLEPEELPAGFCSNPDTDEKVLDLPDSPIEEAWLALAQIEYQFGHGTTVFQHTLRIIDRDVYPELSFFLSIIETRYDFRNEIFNDLPQRMNQLANAYNSMQKHSQSGNEIGADEIDSLPITDLSNFASVDTFIVILVSALFVQLRTGVDMNNILTMWRANSSELPTKENMLVALDLIEAMLVGDHNKALKVMKTQDAKGEKRLVAALKVVQSKETSLGDLLYAHIFITTSLIRRTWEDFVETGLAELLSKQWQERIMEIPIRAVSQVEKACSSNKTGKKKIGQVLLAVLQAISPGAPSDIFQKFRSWAEQESEQKQDSITGKNLIAQHLITAMEKSPRLTHEDVEALQQSIEEGKIPIKFDSPFEPDEQENE